MAVFFFFAWIFFPKEWKRDKENLRCIREDLKDKRPPPCKDMETFDQDVKELFKQASKDER
jgi:hypothetical protein